MGKGGKGKGSKNDRGDYGKGDYDAGKGKKGKAKEYVPKAVVADEASTKAARKPLSKENALLQISAIDPGDDERTAISKKISWILRRGAERINIGIDDERYIKLSDLAKADIMDQVSEQKLMSVINESNAQKYRYEVKDTPQGKMIKAVPKDERRALREGGREDRPAKSEGGVASGAVSAENSKLRGDAPDFEPSASQAASASGYPPAGAYPGLMGYGYPYGYGAGTAAYQMAAYQQMAAVYQMYAQRSIQAAQAAQPTAGGGAPTAAQYVGRIRSYTEDKGFGFVECAEAHAQYGRDVFLHKAHIGELKVGAPVLFAIHVNKTGMPQARDLSALPGGEAAFTAHLAASGLGKGKGKGKGKSESKGKKDKGGEKKAAQAIGAVGYVGSPKNLTNEKIANHLQELIKQLVADGVKVHVGPPNAQLKDAGALEQDMGEADDTMFKVVIVTPGGPGAEAEARKFAEKAAIIALVNSEDEKDGKPAWMSELRAKSTFDFKEMKIDEVADAVKAAAAT